MTRQELLNRLKDKISEIDYEHLEIFTETHCKRFPSHDFEYELLGRASEKRSYQVKAWYNFTYTKFFKEKSGSEYRWEFYDKVDSSKEPVKKKLKELDMTI